MSAAIYRPDQDALTHPTRDDRRSTAPNSGSSHRRRVNDSWFNKARWEFAIALWFVFGVVVLATLIGLLIS